MLQSIFGLLSRMMSALRSAPAASSGPALPSSLSGLVPASSSKTSYQTSEAGLTVLGRYESCRLRAYRDIRGIWTIGRGDTRPDVVEGLEITQVEADARLKRRLAQEFEPAVLTAITRPERQCEFDAMVSLAYNIGVAAFAASTLVRVFNASDTQSAADQFPRWNKAGQQSVLRLRRRRCAERSLFLGADAASAISIGDSHD